MANQLYDYYGYTAVHSVHLAVTAATNATPIAITTSTSHNLATGDYVFIQGVLGNTAANGHFIITFTGANTFTLNGSAGSGAYTSGGAVTNGVDWLNDTIRAVLVDIRGGHYAVSISVDRFLSAISAVDRQDASSGTTTTSPALASKTVSSGSVADAADALLPAVVTDTRPLGAIVIYKDSGAAATSQLIAYLDTVTGLPITPSGADITIVWDSGASRIFDLVNS